MQTQANRSPSFDKQLWFKDVEKSPKLTVHALAVAGVLRTATWGNKVDSLLVSTIAKRAHTSQRSVHRALRDLEAAGLVEVLRRTGKRGGQVSSGFMLHRTDNHALPAGHAGVPKGQPPPPATWALPRCAHVADITSYMRALWCEVLNIAVV